MADEKKRDSSDIESSARARFAAIAKPDVAFEEFVKFERQEVSRRQLLAAGVTQPYVRGLATMTPCGGGARLRDHGVTPDYVGQLARYGIRDVPADRLVQLRDHGVMPDFVGESARQGYRFSTEELIRLRDNGVSTDYLAELKGLGYAALAAEDIVRLRSHGVTADFIRRVNASGGSRRTAAELVALRTGGWAER